MARHTVGTLAARLFGLGGGFIFAVVAARFLGPRGYGVIAVAVSMAKVTSTVALLGINGFALKETASIEASQDWPALRGFVRWSVKAVTVASFTAAIFMAAAAWIPGPYSEALFLGSFAVPLLSGLNLFRGIVQGSGAVIVAQLPMEAVRWLVTIPLLAIMWFGSWNTDPRAVMIALLMGLVIALLAAAASALRLLRRISGDGSWLPRGRYWLLQALPFLAIALFGIVGTEMSTLLLGLLSGPYEAGLYQPIAKLAPLMLLANAAIESALAPRIVQRWEAQDRAGLQRLMGRSAVASTVATAFSAVAIIVASPYILGAFGPEFMRYQQLLGWIAIAQVINAATGSAALMLAMSGDIMRRVFAQITTLVVQVGLGVLMVPTMGAVGAVASLVAAIIIWSVLHWWLALRVTGIDSSLMGVLRGAREVAA
jgi:O-antigen/teichoic acid export membrane protein